MFKKFGYGLSLLAATLFVSAGCVLYAEPAKGLPYTLNVTPGSKLWFEGDSTFHRYESEASVILLETIGELESETAKLNDQALLKNIALMPKLSKFVLDIPVKDLKSGVPGLAGKIHSTLNHKKYPDIVFTMKDYKASPKEGKPGVFNVKATGLINICGQKKETVLDLEVEPSEKYIKVKGGYDILMTDFGVKPPTIMFIKAANKVEIKWELYLSNKDTRLAYKDIKE